MPIYKWNEVRESRGDPEQLGKQRDFPKPEGYVPPPAAGTSAAAITESDRQVAQRFREQAQRDAEQIKAGARADIETMKTKAHDDALREAEEKIQAQFKDNLKKSLDAIQEALDERKKIIKTAEPEILKLGVKIAQQIIHSEITLNRGVIMNVVSDAISKITDREQVIIKVNQADLEQVKDFKDDIEDMLDGAKNLSIVSDKKIEPGGCVIETKIGLVDAKVSTKVEAIEKAFMKVYTEDVKKISTAKGEKLDHQEIYRITGEVPEGDVEPEKKADNKKGKQKASKEKEDFDEENFDLDLDLEEGDLEQTG
ncbi:FliH/SctL family protein [Candidatus Margulisiibacteriota bacterium]